MNKHCFRTIFSKTLQRIVVVSELAKSAGKSESESMTSGTILQKICTIRPLAFSLFCALGFVTLSDNAMAETLIIQADSTAPKNQQPIILQTANGLPQINIQTPNDKGLSHNKYSQFDVAEKGAILNNSRTNTATQQAGMVQGNPYLARGEAKVILNEVNSSKPSVMKGYVEVAGKKAEVIIANPSGLHCDGCGIINADRATLTTGKPQINQGNLESFVVEKGKVTVTGKGMDNSRVDYTDIIAREAQVNAGIWSKKEANVITGKNTVKRGDNRSDSDQNLQIIHTNQPLAGEEKPTVAIDVGELGGMYAGKIHLIGTEQGVGVRNAGHIGASADTLTIDSQGRIVNSGTFNAQQSVQLNAQHGIENHGKIENKQGDIQLNSKADIQNSGSIVARGGNIQKKADTKIQQSGETVAKGNITYTARQIHTDKSSLIAAGVEVTDSPQGEVRKLETQSATGKTIQLTSTEKTTVQGKNIASGKINVAAAEVDANQSQNNAHTVEYSAKSGDIQANSAQFSANQIKLTTPKWLSTEGSQLTAEVIETQQANLNARGSVWKQTGEQDFRLKAENIHTDSARFSVAGRFEIDGNRLTNNQGLLSSGKRLGLNLNDAVDSVDGKLVAKGELSIRTPLLNNQQGLILSGEKQAITVNTLKNQSGVITSQTEQTLNISSELQNQGGRISASGVAINAQSLDNREQGEISSAKGLAITVSQQVDNRHGVIQSVGNLTLNSTLLDNQAGVLKSVADITLNVATVLNNRISENGSLIEAGSSLTMNSSVVENQGTLARQPQPTQGIIASQFVLNSAKQLNNEKGGIYIGSSARFTLSDRLNNRNGEILSWGDLAILGGKSLAITNTEGKLNAKNGLEITAKSLSGDGDVQAGDIRLNLQENFDITNDINANSSLIIQTEGDILNRKKLAANDRLQLTANQITNAQNARISSADTRLTATSTVYNEGLINSRSDSNNSQTVIKAQEIHNIGTGKIYGDKVVLGAERILNQDKDGTSATIAARQSLGLAAKVIENNTLVYEANKKSGSLIYSGGEIAIGRQLNEQDTVIGNAEQLHNRSSIIEAEGRIQLNADKVANVNSHYRSELETTDRQPVNEHFILPRDKHNRGGSDVYDNGHLPTINVNQLRKGYYRKTWSYWQKYDEANLPVITDISQLNATTVLAKPYAQSCANDESVDCTLLPAGNYKKDNPVWTWFNLTPPAEDAPEMTPEIIQAMNEEDLANQHLSEAEQEKLQKEQEQGIAPVVPARPIEPVRGSTETEAQYQKRLQTYQAELKAYEAAEAAYQRYVLLKPLIDWEAKYGANIQALDEAIAKHNKANLSQEYPHFWNLWIKERMVKENITKASLPAQILAGGDLTYQSDEFINDKSWVIAGKALNPIGRGRITNLDDADAVRQDWELGRRQFSFTEYHGGTRRRHSRYDENGGPLARLKEVHKDMNIFVELENTSPTAYTDYVDAKAANDVKPEGNQVERDNLPDAPNPPIMAIERIPSPNAAAFEVRSMTVDTRLPNQGLYRINPQADSHVLIETDPDFTDKKRWLSSDYMFNALRHDHNNVHKRLGDGFYEQRLIREQINRLTGRQFLGDYTDFDSQYKALMDAGITFAQKFNLRLGIALSPEQVASLTSDIVWFETQTVHLPSGETVSVLVPKVYALARKGDIDGKGSLISADALTINSKEIVNQGTISGRRLAQFNAERLENSGTLSGGVLAAKVRGDLENIGGKIEADKAILLDIAGNFNHTTTTRTTQIDLDGFKRTETNLDRKALLHVKDENGLLQVQAGNITLAGADIINDGQGQTYLSAKNQLNLTALQVGFDEKMGGGNHYRNEALNDVLISRVQGKGNVVLSGKNIYTEGAELATEERLALLAENELVLGTVTQQHEYEEYHKHKSRNIVSSSTKEHYSSGDSLQHKGTVLGAKDIVLSATNMTLSATEAVALNNITAIATENLMVDSAMNQSHQHEWEKHKRRGVTASAANGVASVGIGRSKSVTNEDSTSTSLQLSRFKALGNLTFVAENGDLTLNAAQLQSGGDMHLQGSNVSLNALTENESRHVSHYARSSGIGVSMVYSPSQAFKANYGEQANQGSAVGIIGKIFTAADAGAKTTNQILNPGGNYATSQRSQQEKESTQTHSVVTTADAGGNLTIIATQGDIHSQGAQLSAKGEGELWAKENLNLDVAVSTSGQHSQEKRKGAEFNLGKGSAGAYTENRLGSGESRTEHASVLSFGGNVSLNAQEGNVTFKGTQAAAEGNVSVNAGKDVRITTATARTATDESQAKHGVGEVVISETERFNGYHRQLSSENGEQVQHQQALIASLNQSVEINAGNNVHSTSGQILAKNRIDVSAEKVTFDTVHNTGNSQSHSSDLKIGQFSRVSSPIIDLIQSVEQAVNNKEASDRVRLAQALGTAAKAYSTAGDLANGGALFRVETGTGFSHSRERNEVASRESVGNQLNAQHINITSRSGDITATHTAFTSRDEGKRLKDSSITFNSAKDLNLNAGQSEYRMKGRQQNSGFEAGTGVAVGAQTGWYVYAQAGFSNGKQDEYHLTHQNSQIDTKTLNINTQGNTTLQGAVAKANRINADIKGNLTIESLQDIHQSESDSAGFGGRIQAAIGTAWGGSAYGNMASGESNSKQVAEQSGLFAEAGGYNVTANNVELIGGAIASQNPENSTLTTNTITFTDIQNESSSQAVSAGISASANLNKQAGTEAKTDEQAKHQAEIAKLTGTSQSNGINPSVPMFDSSRDSSVTKATLTEGKITLNKDSTPTQTTAKELGINTELSQANRQVEQPKDINQVLKEQQILSQSIGNMQEAANTYVEQKAKVAAEEANKAKAELQAAEKSGDVAKIREKETAYLEARAKEESWQAGADKRKVDAAVVTIGAILSGGSVGQVAVAALSPELNAQIHELTKDSKTANLLAHAALSALEAGVSGNNVGAGAVAGLVGEGSAMLLAETVFNKQPNELTAEERNLLKVAGQLAGAAAGQATGGTTADTVFGAETAKRAVENNYLSADKAKERFEIENRIKLGIATEADLARKQVLDTEDIVNDQKVITACKSDITSNGCQTAVAEALATQQGYHKGYPNETWREYKDILAKDYQQFNDLLYDKTGLALDFEQRAQLVAKGKGISVEEARTQLKYLDRYHMAMGGLATLVGAKHLPGVSSAGKSLDELGDFSKGVTKGANANEKLPKVSNTPNYTVVKVNINGENIWSATKKLTPKENLNEHWLKHKNEFPEFNNIDDYLNFTHDFIKNPPQGTLMKTRVNGDNLMYNPQNNIFISITKDGSPRTMFKPDNGLEYWEKQK